jgi:hypothetical protein
VKSELPINLHIKALVNQALPLTLLMVLELPVQLQSLVQIINTVSLSLILELMATAQSLSLRLIMQITPALLSCARSAGNPLLTLIPMV